MVHSTTIPPKDQQLNPRDMAERLSGKIARPSQGLPQRIPTVAKPGKVVGPVMPYENAGVKDSYDPRRLIRNTTVLLPQPTGIPPAYCFHRNNMTGNMESSSENKEGVLEAAEKRMDFMVHHHKQCVPPGKVAPPDLAIDMRGESFFHHLSAAGGGEVINQSIPDQRITNEVGILQATKPPPFSGGIAAAAAAAGAHHRKVGTIQFGMTRMY